MKIIIGFLLLIIIVAIFKLQTPYKKIFMDTLIESNKINTNKNKLKDFINNLFVSTKEHLTNKSKISTKKKNSATTKSTNKIDTVVNSVSRTYTGINTDNHYLHKINKQLFSKLNNLLIKDLKYIKENPVYGEDTTGSGDKHPHHKLEHVLNEQNKMLEQLQKTQKDIVSQINKMDIDIYNKKKEKEKILKKYILKSSIPVCPQQPDMSKYVKKKTLDESAIPKDIRKLGNF